MIRFAMAALLAALGACSVSTNGLGVAPDGSTGGAGGTAVCPEGLTDRANWPPKTTSTSCTKACGPDSLGVQTCNQTELAACQKESGCVCLVGPCVACEQCAFVRLSNCYLPTNAATAPFCADGVTTGGACAPACDMRLCLEKDGKTGCVCNSKGKYACATWGDGSWE
jgi:hypothetical protein